MFRKLADPAAFAVVLVFAAMLARPFPIMERASRIVVKTSDVVRIVIHAIVAPVVHGC